MSFDLILNIQIEICHLHSQVIFVCVVNTKYETLFRLQHIKSAVAVYNIHTTRQQSLSTCFFLRDKKHFMRKKDKREVDGRRERKNSQQHPGAIINRL